MLAELHIKGFALIDRAEVRLNSGFIALTGATGVGKSLIIDALQLLTGGRASADWIRSGEDEATIEGVFFLPDAKLRKSLAAAAGLDDPDELDEPEIIIHRSFTRAGRNRCRVNSYNVTVNTLKAIGELLVDIHGQNEQQSLLNAARQRELLDSYGELDGLRLKFAGIFDEYRRKSKYLAELRDTQHRRQSELDFCRFQHAEIEAAAIKPGELAQLEQERSLLANAERIQSRIAEAYAGLYEGEDTILGRLAVVVRRLGEIADLDARFAAVIEACKEASVRLEDAAFSLREFIDKWEFDPARQEEIEQRLVQIQKLKSKYGETEEEILAFDASLQEQINKLSTAEDDLKSLDAELRKLATQAQQAGKELSEARRAAGSKLAREIERELKHLGMEKARFGVAVNETPLADAAAAGMDNVEFLIAPNPGEPPMGLRKIASAGEVSRVMLAIKSILAESDSIPLLIFDEIDANIGGRLGRPIGERLARIARCHQVICVTHLPQIASCAHHHLRVSKRTNKGATRTIVEELTGDDRLEEIAEMIGGRDKSEASIRQAREMLGRQG